MQAEGSSSQSSKQRRATSKHVSVACVPCRTRKLKCDGEKPACKRCSGSRTECTYNMGHDKRKPPSKSYIDSLLFRIAKLENDRAPESASRVSTDKAVPDEAGLFTSKVVMDADGVARVVGPQPPLLNLNRVTESDHPVQDLPHQPLCFTEDAIPPPPFLPRYLSVNEHTEMLNLAFIFALPANGGPSRSLFLRGYSRYLSGMPHGSTWSATLHLAILAIASRYLPERAELRADALDEKTAGLVFCEAAMQGFERKDVNRPTAALVQALMILSSYFFLNGRNNLAMVYYNNAVTMSDEIGLHMDCASLVAQGKMTDEEASARRDVFWSLTFFDSVWALCLGRRHKIPLDEVTVAKVEIDDTAEYEAFELPNGAQTHVHWSSSLLAFANLSIIVRQLMDGVYGQNRSMFSRVEAAQAVDIALQFWYTQIPHHLRVSTTGPTLPHVLLLHMYYNTVIILLHRPFFRPSLQFRVRSTRSRGACIQAAQSIVRLAKVYESLYTFMRPHPMHNHLLFVAGTIFFLVAAEPPDATMGDPFGSLTFIVTALRTISIIHPSVRAFADAMWSFQSEWSRQDHAIDTLDPHIGTGISDDATTFPPSNSNNFWESLLAGSTDPLDITTEMMDFSFDRLFEQAGEQAEWVVPEWPGPEWPGL